ncbi:MAG: type IV pilin protein [Bdellovibrionales bacterium]
MNNKGFSLVELMVVVAIIGMLAAVAVPQFSKFQARSRQSEAKSNLSSLYSAQKSFNAEHGGYASNHLAIGFSPAGDVLYNIGYDAAECATWNACSPQFGVVAAVAAPAIPSNANFDLDTMCAAFGATDAVMRTAGGCRLRNAGAANAQIGYIAAIPAAAGTVVNETLFIAGAVAQIYDSSPNNDVWLINQDKVVRVYTNGIP